MNLPRYSLDNRKVIFFFLAILLVGGIVIAALGAVNDVAMSISSAMRTRHSSLKARRSSPAIPERRPKRSNN